MPLQFGVPGGVELLIILIIFGLLGLVVVAVLGAAYVLVRRRGGSSDLRARVDELEAEVERLREDREE